MRIASQVLLFGQEKWIFKYLENIYSHVDKIYITYSNEPWLYNPNARLTYKNTITDDDINKITASKFADKVEIIKGIWDTEDQQRNAACNEAIKNNFEYMFVNDADEFFTEDDFEKIKTYITKYPDINYYSTQSKTFWKSFNNIILNMHRSEFTGAAPIILNLKQNTLFASKRTPNQQEHAEIPEVVFYHGSYVLSNEELLRKLKTWGHASDFNTDAWYQNIWLNWKLGSTNLHPLMPEAWSEVVEYKGQLPDVLIDMI